MILNQENQEKCRKLLDRYGYRPQLMMLIEECSELIKAVCKMFRNGTCASAPSENFLEEMADVAVMFEQACMMFNITAAEINKRAKEKLDKKVSG